MNDVKFNLSRSRTNERALDSPVRERVLHLFTLSRRERVRLLEEGVGWH